MPGTMVDVPTPDGVADAYLARPDVAAHPAVLLIMDAYGVRPQIERMADRISEQGYVVLAPNVFYRDAPSPILSAEEIAGPDAFQKVMPLVRRLTRELIVRDGPAYFDALGTGPVGIAGY